MSILLSRRVLALLVLLVVAALAVVLGTGAGHELFSGAGLTPDNYAVEGS